MMRAARANLAAAAFVAGIASAFAATDGDADGRAPSRGADRATCDAHGARAAPLRAMRRRREAATWVALERAEAAGLHRVRRHGSAAEAGGDWAPAKGWQSVDVWPDCGEVFG